MNHLQGDRENQVDEFSGAKANDRNLKAIANYAYHHPTVTKRQLSQNLDLSLPTVAKNLQVLLGQNYLVSGNTLSSTGGRRAQSYTFNANAQCAVGVDVQRDYAELCAVNLSGNVIAERRVYMKFKQADSGNVAGRRSKEIKKFVQELDAKGTNVLGVAYGVHGFVSPNGKHILFGTLQRAQDVESGALSDYIGKPCQFIHDSYASALAELWAKPQIQNAMCLYLGPRLSGAIILDGSINRGTNMRNGAIEHMTLVPGGRPCYCGKKGCAASYCSTDFLLEDGNAGRTLRSFFRNLNNGNEYAQDKFNEWLRYLALTISNAAYLISGDIILGGEVSEYLSDENLASLKTLIEEQDTLHTGTFTVERSINEPKQELIGLALHYIAPFLTKICGPLNRHQ